LGVVRRQDYVWQLWGTCYISGAFMGNICHGGNGSHGLSLGVDMF